MKKQAMLLIGFTGWLLWVMHACQPVAAREERFFAPEGVPHDTISLGHRLFFDSILSANRTISCATCHKPQFAFADSAALTPGIFGSAAVRNTPSAMNVADQPHFFWDGRAATLEEQALIPIANPIEMNLPVAQAVQRLQEDTLYSRLFRNIFREAPSSRTLALALGAYQRTLETGQTPFDNWRINDDASAVSEPVKRGFAVFSKKGNCVQCHFGTNFNNTEFRNIGLFDGRALNDSGRAAITHRAEDIGKFKIGPLRNIALTAPYMHNGMFKTLREVIDYYDDPDKVVANPINRDSLLSKPLHLTEQEKTDLEHFLRSLTDRRLAGR